jgi:carnosine N-methyltransferase
LTQKQKNYLFDFEKNCEALIECARVNDSVLQLCIEDADLIFDNKQTNDNEDDRDKIQKSVNDVDNTERVLTTLRQIMRDWSSEGADERASCYNKIIKHLKDLYPNFNRFFQFFNFFLTFN